MKKITIVFLLLVGVAVKADANDFSYTGNRAEDLDHRWVPSITDNILLAGPGGDDIDQQAQEFTIDNITPIDNLDVDVTILPTSDGSSEMNFLLYTGSTHMVEGSPSISPVPVASAVAYTSAPVAYTETREQTNFGPRAVRSVVPFEYTLHPGTYWLSEAATAGPYIQLNKIAYESSNTVQTPEPSMFIFFIALAVFLIKRKVFFLSDILRTGPHVH